MSTNRILILLVVGAGVLYALSVAIGMRQPRGGMNTLNMKESWVSWIPGPPTIAPNTIEVTGGTLASSTDGWILTGQTTPLVLSIHAGGGMFSRVRKVELTLLQGKPVNVVLVPAKQNGNSTAPEDQPLKGTLEIGGQPSGFLVPRGGGTITITCSTPTRIRIGAAPRK